MRTPYTTGNDGYVNKDNPGLIHNGHIAPYQERAATQRSRIISILKNGDTLTSLDALHRLGCMRLASRISELRKKGLPVKSRFIKTEGGKQVKEYWLDCA